MKKFVSYVVTFHGKECLLGKYTFSSVYLEQGIYSYIGSNSYEDCEREEN